MTSDYDLAVARDEEEIKDILFLHRVEKARFETLQAVIRRLDREDHRVYGDLLDVKAFVKSLLTYRRKLLEHGTSTNT